MTAVTSVQVEGHEIGPGHPVFLVAEISANHNHDLDRALRLVDVAAEAGVDAVKLQTYTADSMTLDVDRPEFRIGGGTAWDGDTLHRLYGEAATPWAWHEPLRDRARRHGLVFFSTPFDAAAVDLLEALEVPVHKVASFELVDTGLLRLIAATGKPIIMSTGMATEDEVAEAVATLDAAGSGPVVLLKCVSAYPAPSEEMNLRAIPAMVERFGRPVGLSDHTMGTDVAVAAVALGACVIEKHVTLARADGGPDSSFSLEPAELASLVEAVRSTEAALGDASIGPAPSEVGSRAYRRSLFVVEDIAAGEAFTTRNVRAIRPGHGLAPSALDALLGRRASRALERGEPLSWDLVAPDEG